MLDAGCIGKVLIGRCSIECTSTLYIYAQKCGVPWALIATPACWTNGVPASETCNQHRYLDRKHVLESWLVVAVQHSNHLGAGCMCSAALCHNH